MEELAWERTFTVDWVKMNLTELNLLFNILIYLFFINYCPKGFLNFLASFHYLSFDQLIIHSAALLEFCQYCIFLIYSMHLTILNVKKGPLISIINVRTLLHFLLFDVNNLADMKNIFNSSLYIANQLLRVLNLLILWLRSSKSRCSLYSSWIYSNSILKFLRSGD